MLAFVGDAPPGCEVHHLNGDTADNRVINLSYVESSPHRSAHNRGERNFSARLSEADVVQIRTLYATGRYLQRTLAQMYDVDRKHISRIIRHNFWKSAP
jgi:hypothetical protein